jgi:hypothetical protein
MHGATPPFSLEAFALPDASQVFVLAAPLLAIAFVWWLINQTDRIVHRIFPDLEWEKELGWLNIRAERRANTALRWLGYAIYFMLINALYGIAWGAEGLSQLDDWSDPWVMGDLAMRVPALMFCLGIWVLYLGGWLIPKLRAQRETAEWKKARAEMEEAEKERGEHPHSRIHAPLRKPRTNAPLESLIPDQRKRRR